MRYVAMKSNNMEKMEMTTNALEVLISKNFREAFEKAVDTLVERIEVPEDENERKNLERIIAGIAAIAAVREVLGEKTVKLSRVNRKALKRPVFD